MLAAVLCDIVIIAAVPIELRTFDIRGNDIRGNHSAIRIFDYTIGWHSSWAPTLGTGTTEILKWSRTGSIIYFQSFRLTIRLAEAPPPSHSWLAQSSTHSPCTFWDTGRAGREGAREESESRKLTCNQNDNGSDSVHVM